MLGKIVVRSEIPHKRGNIVAETLLWKHCFLGVQTGKHVLKKKGFEETNCF